MLGSFYFFFFFAFRGVRVELDATSASSADWPRSRQSEIDGPGKRDTPPVFWLFFFSLSLFGCLRDRWDHCQQVDPEREPLLWSESIQGNWINNRDVHVHGPRRPLLFIQYHVLSKQKRTTGTGANVQKKTPNAEPRARETR